VVCVFGLWWGALSELKVGGGAFLPHEAAKLRGTTVLKEMSRIKEAILIGLTGLPG